MGKEIIVCCLSLEKISYYTYYSCSQYTIKHNVAALIYSLPLLLVVVAVAFSLLLPSVVPWAHLHL